MIQPMILYMIHTYELFCKRSFKLNRTLLTAKISTPHTNASGNLPYSNILNFSCKYPKCCSFVFKIIRNCLSCILSLDTNISTSIDLQKILSEQEPEENQYIQKLDSLGFVYKKNN